MKTTISKFNNGDMVECINISRRNLTLGKKYKVSECDEAMCSLTDDMNNVVRLSNNRFVKVPSANISLESGKTYLTAGGYLVKIIKQNGGFFTTIDCSPGVNNAGKTVRQLNTEVSIRNNKGWLYSEFGQTYLNDEWNEKLKIVKAMDFPIPKPPVGYKYLDGYPQWRAPKVGEWYAESDTYVEKAYKDLPTPSLIVSPITKEDCVDITESHPDLIPREGIDYFDGPIHEFQITQKGSIQKTIKDWRESYSKFRHYCLPEHVPPISKEIDVYPKYYKAFNTNVYAYIELLNKEKYRCVKLNGEPDREISADLRNFPSEDLITREEAISRIQKPAQETRHVTYPRYYKKITPLEGISFIKRINESQYCVVMSDGGWNKVESWGNSQEKDYASREISEEEAMKLHKYCNDVEKSPEEDSKSPIVSQSKFSYWVTEPIVNMGTFAKKSIRYILVSSVLAGIGYTAYSPSSVGSFIKSCLPKVNIQWEKEATPVEPQESLAIQLGKKFILSKL